MYCKTCSKPFDMPANGLGKCPSCGSYNVKQWKLSDGCPYCGHVNKQFIGKVQEVYDHGTHRTWACFKCENDFHVL